MLFSAMSLPLVAVEQTNTNVATSISQTNESDRTNATNHLTAGGNREQRAAEIRAACIEGRRCVCGKVIEATDDEQLVAKAEAHVAADHPDLVGKVSREDVLARAEEL